MTDFERELVESVKEMVAIEKGELEAARITVLEDDTPKVAAVRHTLGLSQAEFGTLLGVSKHTVIGWEQGRRVPSGAARTLLKIAAKHPEVVLEVRR